MSEMTKNLGLAAEAMDRATNYLVAGQPSAAYRHIGDAALSLVTAEVYGAFTDGDRRIFDRRSAELIRLLAECRDEESVTDL